MFIFILLGLSIATFTFKQKECQCSQLSVDVECNYNTNCLWDATKKTCSRKSCADLTSVCSTVQGCANDSTGACKDFTKCGDYTVSGIGQCQLKDSTCTEDKAIANGYSCKVGAYVPVCQQIKNKTDCRGTQSDGKVCFWTTNPTTKALECMPVTYSKCEDGVSDPNLCTLNPSCKYTTDKKCVSKTCSDVTTEFFCTSVQQWNNANLNLCKWNGSCQDATGVDTLTQTNCYKSTLKNYHWMSTSNKCAFCNDQSASSTGSNPSNSTNNSTTAAKFESILIGTVMLLTFIQ